MGADAFYVCYGLRWEIVADTDEMAELLEARRDPRQIAAHRYHIKSWWCQTVDDGRSVLLIGEMVARFGWENDHDRRMEGPALLRTMEETQEKLRIAGFVDQPAWHFQFEPDR